MSDCGHNKYWTGHYGTCMACRAEKAEAERDRYKEALETISKMNLYKDAPPLLALACECAQSALVQKTGEKL